MSRLGALLALTLVMSGCEELPECDPEAIQATFRGDYDLQAGLRTEAFGYMSSATPYEDLKKFFLEGQDFPGKVVGFNTYIFRKVVNLMFYLPGTVATNDTFNIGQPIEVGPWIMTDGSTTDADFGAELERDGYPTVVTGTVVIGARHPLRVKLDLSIQDNYGNQHFVKGDVDFTLKTFDATCQ